MVRLDSIKMGTSPMRKGTKDAKQIKKIDIQGLDTNSSSSSDIYMKECNGLCCIEIETKIDQRMSLGCGPCRCFSRTGRHQESIR